MKLTPGYLVLERSVLWTPLEIEGATGKAWIKIFGKDPDTQATAALVKYEKGFRSPASVSKVYSDTLFLSGKMCGDGRTYTKSSYIYRPPGVIIGPMVAEDETVRLVITGGLGDMCSDVPVFVQDCHSADRKSVV